MSKVTKNRNMTGSKTARVILLVALALAFVVSIIGIGSEAASAATFTDDGYVNQLMTGDTGKSGGWNENVIINVDPSLQGTSADSVARNISGFFASLAGWIIGMAVVFAGIRLAGRGICEMVISDDGGTLAKSAKGKKGGSSAIPGFFLTASERKGTPSSEWVKPMLVETGMFLGVALFVGTIVGILAGISLTLIDQANIAYNTPDQQVGTN